MEKDPNGPPAEVYPPPAEGYPPPPTYQQQQNPGYPPPQAGFVQPGPPGYGAQPGAPGYAPQPGAPRYAPQPGAPGYAPQPGAPGYGGQPYGGQPAGTVYVTQSVQPATHVTIVRNRPNNYLGLAIFVTLCCCLPFGIIGIVYSIDSSSKFDRGDAAGSEASANTAKSWSIAGLVCGIIWITIYIILQVTVFAASSYNSY